MTSVLRDQGDVRAGQSRAVLQSRLDSGAVIAVETTSTCGRVSPSSKTVEFPLTGLQVPGFIGVS